MDANKTIDLWLDCDPGHDDAFAILFAAHHAHLNLLGISTIHGNASLAHTTHNALALLTAMGVAHKIPVYAGASTGLHRPVVHACAIHGESGLDGTDLLPTPTNKPQREPAVEAMARTLLATEKGTAWLVATGALTNVAMLMEKYPAVAGHIKGLSLMGGAVGGGFTNATMGKVDDRERIGNWSPWAEFNILVDPEAADIVFSNDILTKKTVMIPLDLTHLVLATNEVQNMLLHGKDYQSKGSAKGKSTLRIMLVELLTFFAHTYATVFGFTEGPPLHDPLAVAVILDGILDEEIPFVDIKDGVGERFEVKVITEGTHEEARKGAQTGRTVVRLLPEGQEGVKIPRSLDIGRFWDVLEACLQRADKLNKAPGGLR